MWADQRRPLNITMSFVIIARAIASLVPSGDHANSVIVPLVNCVIG